MGAGYTGSLSINILSWSLFFFILMVHAAKISNVISFLIKKLLKSPYPTQPLYEVS